MPEKKANMPLYVIGHQNPDTDAICAAIGYADLLRKKGKTEAKATRCGKVPARTAWVLKQAGEKKPLLLSDVSATAEMICRKDVVQADEHDSFLSAYNLMLSSGVRSIPVVNARGQLSGILRFLDLLQLLMPTDTQARSVREMNASPQKIANTLKAETCGAPLASMEEKIIMLVGASSIETTVNRLNKAEKKGDLECYVVLCGDRPSIQREAIRRGVKMLVVTGGFRVDDDLIEQAKQNKVAILHCGLDTASATKLIRCSREVHHALDDNVVKVFADESVIDLRKRLARERQELFPVVNPGDNTLIGVISKSDLIDPPQIRLVLVDHNEYSQAVEGVEEADVIEVIDHHRLAGDLISREPIRYINEPVGSTSTLVAREYRYAGIEMPKGIALCLIAGMISDTLNLTSPTTSDLDREILPWLCDVASIEAEQFTRDFFSSGSLLAHNTALEAVSADRKVFEENGAKVSISHVEESGLELFEKRCDELKATLDELIAVKGYKLALLIVTDIITHHSVLLASGDPEIIEALPYERGADGVFQAPGVVSRKKQVFPSVCQALRVAAVNR